MISMINHDTCSSVAVSCIKLTAPFIAAVTVSVDDVPHGNSFASSDEEQEKKKVYCGGAFG